MFDKDNDIDYDNIWHEWSKRVINIQKNGALINGDISTDSMESVYNRKSILLCTKG